MTYAQQRAVLFDLLAERGWEVSRTLKVPWARRVVDLGFTKVTLTLWFKTQAVHCAFGTTKAKDARSLCSDIKTFPNAETLLAYVSAEVARYRKELKNAQFAVNYGR